MKTTLKNDAAGTVSVAGAKFPALNSIWTVLAVFAASVAFYWHGFGPPGDAERYAEAAFRWVENGFYLGKNHWSLRHLYVAPMAGAIAIFGPSELAVTAPNIAYAGGLVAITYIFMRRYVGALAAFFTAAFIATSAFFVARPIEVGVYGVEVFFAASACWLYVAAQLERRRMMFLFTAGLACGLAWTLREQTIYLIIALGVVSIIIRRQALLSLTALGLGFGTVILAEWFFYLLAAGDPFYRYRIDLQHRVIGLVHDQPGPNPLLTRLVRPFRDMSEDPIATPFIALAAACVFFFRKRILNGAWSARRRIYLVFATAAAVSVFVSGYGFNLALVRYYPLLPYLAFMTIGITLAIAWREIGRSVAVLLALLVVFVSLAAEDFSNYHEYEEARALARIAIRTDEPIYTDPLNASRARYQMLLMGASREKVRQSIRHESRIPTGSLLFKTYLVRNKQESWCVLESANVRPMNWTHAAIRMSGADSALGSKVRRIVARPAPVALVRVLPRPAESDPYSGRACLPLELLDRQP